MRVAPALRMYAALVTAQIEIGGPLLRAHRRRITRAGDVRLTSIYELRLGTLATVGALDEQHGVAPSVRHSGGRRLVNEVTVAEALEREGCVERMWLIASDGPGEDVCGPRCRLESSGPPAAIDVQTGDPGLADDRRSIRRHVHDAAPAAQHAHAAEHGEQLADRLERMAGDVRAAALRVGGIGIRAGADHELALIRLADIRVDGVGHDDTREHRLHRLRDEGLQRIALERQLHIRHLQDHAGMPGRGNTDTRCADRAAGGLDAFYRTGGVAPDTRYLAVLDDVDTECIGGARVTPGHGIVAGGAAAAVQGGPEPRGADVTDIQQRTKSLCLARCEPLVVDSGRSIGVHVTLRHLHVMYRVGQHQHTTLREHDV